MTTSKIHIVSEYVLRIAVTMYNNGVIAWWQAETFLSLVEQNVLRSTLGLLSVVNQVIGDMYAKYKRYTHLRGC